MGSISPSTNGTRAPIGLKWRSSVWAITFVIGLGVAVDLIVYSIIIPVIPFQLEHLGYTNVSSLTGWLLFAYSAGLVIFTIPIAWFSERYNARQYPLIIGLLVLTASQIMLMEAPNYPVMCIARILQGFGSSIVWVVGLALLCDTAPASTVALHIGCAMIGLSIGLVLGPSVGGELYHRFGFRGPFIFGIITTIVDLLGRLIIIERKVALRYGIDPAAIQPKEDSSTTPDQSNEVPSETAQKEKYQDTENVKDTNETCVGSCDAPSDPEQHSVTPPKPLSLLSVIFRLGKSPRTLVVCFLIFVYGIVYSSQEPSIPVHLQRTWGLNSRSVGLVFIAAVVPTLFSSPLSGYLSDRYGVEWVTSFSLLLAIPWWCIITIEHSLALFIVAFGFQSFFTSSVISPLTAELAETARETEGVGYGHVYGAFNLVFGIGSALGPIIGGQIYDHLKRGWLVLCFFAVGMLALSVVLAFGHVGRNPLMRRLSTRLNNKSLPPQNTVDGP